jgi:glycerol-3-phosphate acyltransferase PlsX
VGAVVSAGNSGAMLACGLFVMKRLTGVERPGIITTFPTRTGVCALIDMGANVECRPQTLAQFSVLGAVYARLLHHKARPRVGLLANGEEASKGTDLTRGAHKLLSAPVDKDFDYLGYVEGRDIFSGHVDVVVTDGFTGNIVLKTSEGAGAVISEFIRAEIMATTLGKLGALLLTGALRNLKRKLDYAEHGGAPLLGVDGVAVLCHGRSNAKAIKNGIRVAAGFSDAALPKAVADAIAKHAPLWAPELVQASGS